MPRHSGQRRCNISRGTQSVPECPAARLLESSSTLRKQETGQTGHRWSATRVDVQECRKQPPSHMELSNPSPEVFERKDTTKRAVSALNMLFTMC